MKKLFFTVGVITILFGVLILIAYSNGTPSLTQEKIQTVVAGYDVWEVSGNYTAGDYIHVRCNPPANWSSDVRTMDFWELPDDWVMVYHKHIWFEITDPSGNITEYNTAWALSAPASSGGVFAKARINVTIRGGGIEVAQYPAIVGGKALLSGTYKVNVPQYFEPEQDYYTPPGYLALEKTIIAKVYPFAPYLLLGGISISAVGAVVSVKAATSKKNRTKKSR